MNNRPLILRHLIALAMLLAVVTSFQAQSTFVNWDDEDQLFGAFFHNPAYRTTTDNVFALNNHFTSYTSNIDSPIFLLSDDFFETNTNLWLAPANSNGGILQVGDDWTINSPFGHSGGSGVNWVGQRSQVLLFGYSAYNKSLSRYPRRNLFRLSVIYDKLGSFKYGLPLSQFANQDNIVWPVNSSFDDLGDFSFRHQAYFGVCIGKSIELTPLRSAIGFNIKALGGTEYFSSSLLKGDSAITIISSGYEFNEGIYDTEKVTFINGTGVAADLGLSFYITRQWELSFGVTDIGLIAWNNVEETRLTSSPEVILGTRPLSGLFESYSDSVYVSAINDINTEEISDFSKTGIWLDSDLNVNLTGQYDQLGFHLLYMRSVNNQELRYENQVIGGKVSYLFNEGGRVKFRGAAGFRNSDYSGTSLSLSGRIDLDLLDFYLGMDGLSSKSTPYNRSMIIMGIQLSPTGKIDLRRI